MIECNQFQLTRQTPANYDVKLAIGTLISRFYVFRLNLMHVY